MKKHIAIALAALIVIVPAIQPVYATIVEDTSTISSQTDTPDTSVEVNMDSQNEEVTENEESTDNNQGDENSQEAVENDHSEEAVEDEENTENVIEDAANFEGLPYGLAKRETLPPGLAKKDILPPGLQKRIPTQEQPVEEVSDNNSQEAVDNEENTLDNVDNQTSTQELDPSDNDDPAETDNKKMPEKAKTKGR